MNKRSYTEEYRKIVNELIKKSFPLLKKKIIFVNEKKLFNLKYSATTVYFIFFSTIWVHPKVRKYSKSSLYALFTHELAHIDLIVNMTFIDKIKFAFRWLFTKKGKENFERDADILTVKKGYGKNRLKLEGESKKTYTKQQLKKMRKGYLSPRQIKDYIKKFKK
jgi:hypothetical protein